MDYDKIIKQIFNRSFIPTFEIERVLRLYSKMELENFLKLCEYLFLNYKHSRNNIYILLEKILNNYHNFEFLEYFVDKNIYIINYSSESIINDNPVFNIIVVLFKNEKKEYIPTFLKYVENDPHTDFTKPINRILNDDNPELIKFILDDNDIVNINFNEIIKYDCSSLCYLFNDYDVEDIITIMDSLRLDYSFIKCLGYIIDYFNIPKDFIVKIVRSLFLHRKYLKCKISDIRYMRSLIKILDIYDINYVDKDYELYNYFIEDCLYNLKIFVPTKLIPYIYKINFDLYTHLNLDQISENRKNDWNGYWFNRIKKEFNKEEIFYFYDDLFDNEDTKFVYTQIQQSINYNLNSENYKNAKKEFEDLII